MCIAVVFIVNECASFTFLLEHLPLDLFLCCQHLGVVSSMISHPTSVTVHRTDVCTVTKLCEILSTLHIAS